MFVPVRTNTSVSTLYKDGGFRHYLSKQTKDLSDYKAHADICTPANAVVRTWKCGGWGGQGGVGEAVCFFVDIWGNASFLLC